MVKPVRFGLIFIVFAAMSVVFFNMAKAQQGDVKIVYLKGDPKIMKSGTNTWSPCDLKMAVGNGDRIKTLDKEAVEISFSKKDANIVRIEPNSDVFVRKSESPYLIELMSGTAMALINDLPKGSAFEVKTPLGLSGARATGWTVSADEAASMFSALEDSIYTAILDEFGNIKGDMVNVKEGWKLILEKDKAMILERLTAGDFQKWNEWRQDVLSRLGLSSMVNLNQAGNMGNAIDQLDSKKDNVNENRDEQRIEARQGGVSIPDTT
ncbi:MAG: FecR domain-containing protein [Candidatus Omnitrophota bacterium]